MGFFDKIKQGLTKTKTKMDAQLTGIFAAYEPGDEEFFEDLEETLILADTGVETTTKAITPPPIANCWFCPMALWSLIRRACVNWACGIPPLG